MTDPDPRDDRDPADVEPTDNSTGTAVDPARMPDVEQDEATPSSD
jgi:hypothetical protein